MRISRPRISRRFDRLLRYFSSAARARLREPIFLEMLLDALENGAALVEVGTNDGREAIEALRSDNTDLAVVIAEPDQRNMKRARDAISRAIGPDAPVRFIPVGIWDRSGPGSFFLNGAESNLNTSSRKPGSAATVEIEVDYLTLPKLLEKERLSPPLIFKMDIEGHEVEVLNGAIDYLVSQTPIKILLEVHPSLYGPSHSLAEVLNRLFAGGYRTALLESAGGPVPHTFAEAGLSPIKTIGRHGLYRDVANDLVREFACFEHIDQAGSGTRTTRKVVRSLLLVKP
jgi:FkbM family methyltransferase